MSESDLTGRFMPALKKAEFHAVRIENSTESGTPDINYAKQRAQGWIETKVAKGSFVYFELFQIPWFRRRLRATEGRYLWVLVENARTIVLYPASAVLAAPREPVRDWVRVRQEDLGAPVAETSSDRPDWSVIIEALTNES